MGYTISLYFQRCKDNSKESSTIMRCMGSEVESRIYPSCLPLHQTHTIYQGMIARLSDTKRYRYFHFSIYVGHDKITRTPLAKGELVILASSVSLKVDHFSWGVLALVYDWLFAKEKRMLCTPFLPKTIPEEQTSPILHLRIYDNLPGNSMVRVISKCSMHDIVTIFHSINSVLNFSPIFV